MPPGPSSAGTQWWLSVRRAGTILGALGCQRPSSRAPKFSRKWVHRLPVATPCVVFDRNRGVQVLSNADCRTDPSPMAWERSTHNRKDERPQGASNPGDRLNRGNLSPKTL